MMYLDLTAVRERAIAVSSESAFALKRAAPETPRYAPDWSALDSINVVHVVDDPFSWKGLMVRTQRGDKRAYRELLTQFGDALEQLFTRFLPQDTVEDAVEDSLKAVNAQLHTCSPKKSILAWLLAIGIHQARRHPVMATIDLKLS